MTSTPQPPSPAAPVFTEEQLAQQVETWNTIGERLKTARAIMFDGCHKIYLIMDNESLERLYELHYLAPTALEEDLKENPEAAREHMLGLLQEWYRNACGLRLISAISSVPEGADPNEGFERLIRQFHEAFQIYEDED